MKYKDFHKSKRTIRRFNSEDCAVEQPSYSLRELVDNMLSGKPVNSNLRHHQPLPPDGEDDEDYEYGTREVNDLADLAQLHEEVENAQDAINQEVDLRAKEAKKAEFDKAVEAEILRRSSAQ